MDLSILLVTYNQEKYIRESLDSILMQDLPDSCEIVVAGKLSKQVICLPIYPGVGCSCRKRDLQLNCE